MRKLVIIIFYIVLINSIITDYNDSNGIIKSFIRGYNHKDK